VRAQRPSIDTCISRSHTFFVFTRRFVSLSHDQVINLLTTLFFRLLIFLLWQVFANWISVANMATIAEDFRYKKNSVASVRERTIPTERPPSVSEVSSNFFKLEGANVVSVTNPYGRILGFLDRSRYYCFQVAPQLYSRGWVDPVPDPLLFFLVVSGNRTRDLRICSQELWPLVHRKN
jgi:hypothetical protein